MNEKMSKFRVFLSSLLVAGLLSFGIQSQKAQAYQFTAISANDDAGRHRELLWVYNAEASTALANGDTCQWFDGTLADGLEVKIGATEDSNLFAGVSIGAIPATTWGFIQTRGYHSAVKIEVSNSAADALSIGAADGKSKVSATAGMRQFGVALEATTSSTTVKAIIRG